MTIEQTASRNLQSEFFTFFSRIAHGLVAFYRALAGKPPKKEK